MKTFTFIRTAALAIFICANLPAGSITTLFPTDNTQTRDDSVIVDIAGSDRSGEQDGLGFNLDVYLTATTFVGTGRNLGEWTLFNAGSEITAPGQAPLDALIGAF